MSALTAEELAQLAPAMRRLEQQREYAQHTALQDLGQRPAGGSVTFQQNQLEVSRRSDVAREQLAVALAPGTPLDARRAAARAAVDALPRRLAMIAEAAPKGRTPGLKRFRRKASLAIADVASAVAEALKSDRAGPNVVPSAMGNRSRYVQQEDLDDLVPDGWGASLPLEAANLGKRAGIPPKGVALLCLLTWVSAAQAQKNNGYRTGAGLQASVEWLARKLGCTGTWVKILFQRLDPFAQHRRNQITVKRENLRRGRKGLELLRAPRAPTGTPLVHRFRMLERYENVPQADGVQRQCWRDKQGKPHFYVDVRGVLYATDSGRGILVRRAHRDGSARAGVPPELSPYERPNGLLIDLSRRLMGLHWRLEARLGPVDNSHENDALLRGRAPAD